MAAPVAHTDPDAYPGTHSSAPAPVIVPVDSEPSIASEPSVMSEVIEVFKLEDTNTTEGEKTAEE